MILSLSVVIVAAILASIALFFLLGSHIAEMKKQQILVIVGGLIFVSLLISSFKSQDIITFSLLNSVAKNKINSIFSNELPAYNQKYNFDPSLLGDYLLEKNYEFGSGSKDYNEYIIYLSDKDQGASFFLYQLTQKFRGKGIPAFYVKMESPSGTSKEFFRKTGLNSYESFKHALDYYLQQNVRIYVIIDNAQLLPRPIWDILDSYQQAKGPQIILNSENVDALLERINEIDRGNDFLRRFQVQRFNGPDQAALQKLSPSNSYSKKLPVNFETINYFRAGSTQQQIALKSGNADNAVANYFGLTSYYNQVKRLMERGPVYFGKLRQSNIPFQILQQMQKLRLITFKNGQILLQ